MKTRSGPEGHSARGPEAGKADRDGFSMFWNRLVTNGVLAHLRADAIKVYLAILFSARKRNGLSCFSGVEALARLSGLPRSQVSAETEYLEQHRVILKGWIQVAGKPRRTYRVIPPESDMFPDHRGSCSVCMVTDHRGSCWMQDPKTGRLLGKRPRSHSPDHRDAHSPDHRDSRMFPDHRDTNQTEADVKVLGRREGCRETQSGGALRFASPLEAAPLRPPSVEADPAGERKAAWEGKNGEQPETAPETTPKPPTGPETLSSLPPLPIPPVDEAARRRTRLRELLAPRPGQDMSYYVLLAQKAGYPEGEIGSVLAELPGAAMPMVPAAPPPGDGNSPAPDPRRLSERRLCAATTRANLECVLRPLPGSAFCARHGAGLAGRGKPS